MNNSKEQFQQLKHLKHNRFNVIFGIERSNYFHHDTFLHKRSVGILFKTVSLSVVSENRVHNITNSLNS